MVPKNLSFFEQGVILGSGRRFIDVERVIFWVVEKAYKEKSFSIKELKDEFRSRNYLLSTIETQIQRLRNDLFIYLKDGYVKYRLEGKRWNYHPYKRGFNL